MHEIIDFQNHFKELICILFNEQLKINNILINNINIFENERKNKKILIEKNNNSIINFNNKKSRFRKNIYKKKIIKNKIIYNNNELNSQKLKFMVKKV